MSDQRYGQAPITPIEPRPLQDVSGVLGSRLFAWIGDIIILFFLGGLIFVLLLILGIVTFGATWLLIPIATVATALGYAALTIGGPRQSTWGMRMAGLKVETANGGRPDGLAAAVHALLFYVAAGTVGSGSGCSISCAVSCALGPAAMGHDL
jgi:uncharacterized RDD family membrane protein YckC